MRMEIALRDLACDIGFDVLADVRKLMHVDAFFACIQADHLASDRAEDPLVEECLFSPFEVFQIA